MVPVLFVPQPTTAANSKAISNNMCRTGNIARPSLLSPICWHGKTIIRQSSIPERCRRHTLSEQAATAVSQDDVHAASMAGRGQEWITSGLPGIGLLLPDLWPLHYRGSIDR